MVSSTEFQHQDSNICFACWSLAQESAHSSVNISFLLVFYWLTRGTWTLSGSTVWSCRDGKSIKLSNKSMEKVVRRVSPVFSSSDIRLMLSRTCGYSVIYWSLVQCMCINLDRMFYSSRESNQGKLHARKNGDSFWYLQV